MTPEELDEIEARAKAATEGPWEVEAERPDGGTRLYVAARNDNASAQICRVTPIVEGSTRRWAQEDMAEPARHEADASFIAAARSDVPALVEEVRRLREAQQEAAKVICLLFHGLQHTTLVGNAAPVVRNIRRDMEASRLPGRFVMEMSSGVYKGLAAGDAERALNAMGFVERVVREPLAHWDDSEGDPNPGEDVWYIRTLGGDVARWVNCTFLAVPAQRLAP